MTEQTKEVQAKNSVVPHVDIVESEETITIMADMPGVDENSVDITLEKDVLSISGSVEIDKLDNFTPAYIEFESDSYQRDFTLSNSIDRENISATVKDGVLNLVLPKLGPAQAQKIAVSAA
jgi:HSP20 family molecular chaperone IbpA